MVSLGITHFTKVSCLSKWLGRMRSQTCLPSSFYMAARQGVFQAGHVVLIFRRKARSEAVSLCIEARNSIYSFIFPRVLCILCCLSFACVLVLCTRVCNIEVCRLGTSVGCVINCWRHKDIGRIWGKLVHPPNFRLGWRAKWPLDIQYLGFTSSDFSSWHWAHRLVRALLTLPFDQIVDGFLFQEQLSSCLLLQPRIGYGRCNWAVFPTYNTLHTLSRACCKPCAKLLAEFAEWLQSFPERFLQTYMSSFTWSASCRVRLIEIWNPIHKNFCLFNFITSILSMPKLLQFWKTLRYGLNLIRLAIVNLFHSTCICS